MRGRRLRASSPGARPAGVHEEGEAACQVQEMFARIAPRYDFLNHLLSFSFDRLWRRRTSWRFRPILQRSGARVLDLCCGTGDLTLALERVASPDARILGTDFVPPMLALAKEKAHRAARRSQFFASDALSLPLPDASFDLVTAAFGFRNLANYERGLREIARILRPGAEVGILDFAEPRAKLLAPLFRFYFTKVLPRIGRAISGSPTAYSYLPASVAKFPPPEDLSALLTSVGFVDVHFELWASGIVALHRAKK